MTSPITFADLGLAESLLRAIADTGYTAPTPIQAKAIPLVLKGGDLLAAAQTGTGKTAGFTLPILHLLETRPASDTRKPGRPRCLILTPTRELAAQIEESVQTYGKYSKQKAMVMFGGVNINPQIGALKRPLDILVATPGRLLDHAGQRTVDLSGVEILVLDEADRMLDMGFIRDVRKILALLPKQRQNLLFSATFSEEIRALARGVLNNPGEVSVTPRNTATELVHQTAHMVDQAHKRDLISHIINESGWHQVLVFTRTKHGANRLAEKLVKDGLSAAAIHGNKSQAARTRALAGFKDGSVAVLVATDIAARGIDIDQLPQVVNFELPNVPEDYVHRIGRTGRAGSTGSAVSLVDASEVKLLKAIERLIGKTIERVPVTSDWTPPVGAALDVDAREERTEQRRFGNGNRGGNAGGGNAGHNKSRNNGTGPTRGSPVRAGGNGNGGGHGRPASAGAAKRPEGDAPRRHSEPRGDRPAAARPAASRSGDAPRSAARGNDGRRSGVLLGK